MNEWMDEWMIEWKSYILLYIPCYLKNSTVSNWLQVGLYFKKTNIV